MKKKAFWISYDFGLKGDYSGLYTWLDNMRALECGGNLAYFNLDLLKTELSRESSSKELVAYIERSLMESIKLTQSDRIYLIWRDNESKLIKGKFINGNRKQAPWLGYGSLNKFQATDDGE